MDTSVLFPAEAIALLVALMVLVGLAVAALVALTDG
jgi:hypothetical protein